MPTKYTRGANGYFSARVWDGTYDVKGHRHYKMIRSKKSSGDLEKKVKAFEEYTKEHGGTPILDTNITLSALAEEWLKVAKAQRENATREMYENSIKKLAPIGNFRVKDLSFKHLQFLINENAAHPRACVKLRLTYRQIMKYAEKCHVIRSGAAEELCDVTMPVYRAVERRALTQAELEAVRAARFDARERAFIQLLLGCGLRRGEAMALKVSDFDFKAGTVSISKAVGFYHGAPELKDTKNRVHRVVPLPGAVRATVRDLIAAGVKGPDAYLFPQKEDTKHGSRGDLMTQGAFKHLWACIVRKISAQLPEPTDMTAHMCRHNYCTRLCYEIPKISTKKIAELMGDTEQMVLKVYSHILDEKEDLDAAIGALERMLS